MRPVAPRLVGVDEETIGDRNELYRAITIGLGVTDAGERSIITRWRPSAQELDRLLQGEDVFVFLVAPQLTPIQVHVGSPYHEMEPA